MIDMHTIASLFGFRGGDLVVAGRGGYFTELPANRRPLLQLGFRAGAFGDQFVCFFSAAAHPETNLLAFGALFPSTSGSCVAGAAPMKDYLKGTAFGPWQASAHTLLERSRRWGSSIRSRRHIRPTGYNLNGVCVPYLLPPMPPKTKGH